MIPAASSDLITALKASLASSPAGWLVTDVSESSGTRIGSVTPVHVGGDPNAALINVNVTSSTTVITQIDLAASPLRIAVGAVAPMALTYLSVWIDGSFSAGQVLADGAALTTSDSALDTTIRGLASTFLAAKDTSLKNALNAGPVSPSTDPLLIPSGLLTALKATLADSDAGWEARSYNQNVNRGANNTVTTMVIISLSSAMFDANGNDVPYVRLISGSSAPGQFSYTATFDSLGNLIDANVQIDATMWRTGLDSALNTTVLALGSAFLTAQNTSLTAAFTAGPVAG
jgi:hypothetical protein